MTSTPLRSTRPRTTPAGSVTSTYTALSAEIKREGLLRRHPGFYLTLVGGLLLALVGGLVGVLLLASTWYVLLVAGALGIVFTQLAFVSHEAAHRQVFASNRWNDLLAKALGTGLVGMSYSWWMSKHSRHHANPNHIGKDPDIAVDTVAFDEDDARKRTGAAATLTRFQGYLFLPLLLLEGVNLHYMSVRAVLAPGGRDRAWERALLFARLGLYVAAAFWLMPPGVAAAFLGVQVAVFGFYMGSAFSPNHIGMPMIAHDRRLDFLSKQVLTSRNIRGGWFMTAFFGGLNHQVEHHLFPSMARPALVKARRIVKEHCASIGVPYTETGFFPAYRAVLEHMNRVGLAARDPFLCPMVARYRI